MRFGRHLVVLGLSLDADKAKARKFVKQRELPWLQGFLGEWSDTPVPAKCGISSVPAYFLIGPDGKLLQRSYANEEIGKKVSSILEPKQ